LCIGICELVDLDMYFETEGVLFIKLDMQKSGEEMLL
jgi:hypothetical protein